ncbi:MAG TPA: hypothetical protein VG389_12120 [Myxococcota bacterium]|jgi:hypothetical protein|nr:hypothetical protein [Myxococcota bacterium]
MKTALAVLLGFSYPLTVFADEAPAPPAPAPETAPATMAAPAPASAPAPAAAPRDSGRFRWGISAGAGTFVPGPMVNFGTEVRAGWQINPILGVSVAGGAESGFFFGGRVTTNGAALSVSAVSFWHVGVEAEAMFGNMFFVAGGPHLLRGGWGSVREGADSNGAVTQSVLAVGGWMPGFDFKVGLGFGKPRPSGRRNQFTLSLDTMFAFAPPGVYVAQNVDANGNVTQDVSRTGFAIGIAPMLMFGFEMR